MVDPESFVLLLAANGTPVVAAWLLGSRVAWPLDAGREFRDGRRLLGAHKTWRGLVLGIVVAGIAGAAMRIGVSTAAAFGALALAGDLVSSFFKRRLGRVPGRESLLLDPLPESVLPMLVLQRQLGLDAAALLGTTLLFALLNVTFSRAMTAFRAGGR